MNWLKRDSFFWVCVFCSLIMISACFENGPLHHAISSRAFFFINSFFGYKFFHREVCFFLSDFFLLIIFGICFFKMRKRSLFFEKSSFYLLFFVFFLFISALSSHWPRASQFFLVFNFFTMYLLAASLSSVLNEGNIHRFLNIVLGALLLVSFFECFLGFYQYFMQKSLGLKGLHEPYFSEANLGLASIPSESGSRWIFDDIFHVKRYEHLILRATGSFGHANNYGGFMLFSSLASIYFYLFSQKTWQRVFLSIFLFLQVFGIYLSFSRSALFGFIISITCFFILVIVKRRHLPKMRYKSLFFVVCASLFFSFLLLLPQLIDRGGVVTYNSLAKASDKGRVNFQIVAFEMIKKHPISGVGLSRFHQRCFEFIPLDKREEICIGIVHNIYLLIVSENGILALLALLLFIFSVFKAFFYQSPNVVLMLFISFFTGFLFIGCCDYYLIDKTVGRLIFLFIPSVVAALGHYKYGFFLRKKTSNEIKIPSENAIS